MNLKNYLNKLNVEEREKFAARCGTSFGYLKLIAYGERSCSPSLAVSLQRESAGELRYRELCPSPKIDWDYVEGQCSRI